MLRRRPVLSSAGRGCRLWHHPSPLGRKRVSRGGGSWGGTPARASPQRRREPGSVGSQGLTGGAEGLLHQAHLHHLRGWTRQMIPWPLSPRPPNTTTLTPTKGTNFWQESSSGLRKEETLVRVWAYRAPCGQPRGPGTPTLAGAAAGSRPLGASPLPSLPWDPCPRHGSTGHTTQGGRGSAPAVLGGGLHAGGQPCPAAGPRLLCTARGTDAHGREGGPGSGTASTSQYLI